MIGHSGIRRWSATKHLASVVITFLICYAQFGFAAEVTVEGNKFLVDGKPWVAEGVVLVGMLAPAEKFRRPAYAKAHKAYGPALLKEIRAYGADTIRLKVRQEGLDRKSPFFIPSYRTTILDVVHELRKERFFVIISMLSLLGEAGRTEAKGGAVHVPDDSTVRAWQAIVDEVKKDRGILFEIYDEPSLKDPTPGNWEMWRKGMQSTVNAVRASGAKNVILLDGLRTSHILEGSPKVDDPTGQLGYAIHPYLFHRHSDRATWDRDFGRFAERHAVIASEWNALSDRNAQCVPDLPLRASEFLQYLQRKRIGLVVWAYDLPGVKEDDGQLTTFKGFRCGEKTQGRARLVGQRYGAGELVHRHFLAH